MGGSPLLRSLRFIVSPHSQDTILVDMLAGPDHSKNVSYCVTDPDVSERHAAVINTCTEIGMHRAQDLPRALRFNFFDQGLDVW